MGRPIVSAEAFTSVGGLDAYPWSLKNQGDWAFCVGINRFVFHTYAHQALGDAYKPGMTMGPYGVHWHRNQTWWPMVSAYHRYLTRCSELLRQGVTVSDVLYLTPEGTPHIFLPPPSALEGSGPLADKKGYGFDGCSPKILMARAEVKDGLIAFPGRNILPVAGPAAGGNDDPGAARENPRPGESRSHGGRHAAAQITRASPAIPPATLKSNRSPRTSGGAWMRRRRRRSAVMAKASSTGAANCRRQPQTVQHDSISESAWIWYPEGNPAQSAPPATRYFQRIIHVDAKKALKSATAALSADNAFTLWINGKKVSEGDNFHVTFKTSIESFLRPGANVIAVAVVNSAGSTQSRRMDRRVRAGLQGRIPRGG